MTDRRGHVEELVMRIQGAFLDDPGLTLSAAQAPQMFGADDVMCDAVLRALVDARVLANTGAGAYFRFFPSRDATPDGSGTPLSTPTARRSGHRQHRYTHHAAA